MVSKSRAKLKLFSVIRHNLSHLLLSGKSWKCRLENRGNHRILFAKILTNWPSLVDFTAAVVSISTSFLFFWTSLPMSLFSRKDATEQRPWKDYHDFVYQGCYWSTEKSVSNKTTLYKNTVWHNLAHDSFRKIQLGIPWIKNPLFQKYTWLKCDSM